uniref:AIG1-type G domain-containing protein n=2 Tax=Poecilia mexicana TaxID=48701 RepID=A0A3B3WLG5_9TELE
MKINKTILLVGETGTGKSTLLNALFNYAVGVKFGDNVWFQIIEEEKSNQSQSQTSDVIVYQIFGLEGKTLPCSLTIIDTPGFGSTRGIEEDNSVSRRLFDLFRSPEGVHQINAVGLVMKATDNRLSDRLRYVFDSVTSLFGKDVERNIVALITHSDGKRPENVLQALKDAKIKCSKDEMNQPVHFMFNNQQKEERKTTEKEKDGSNNSWDITNQNMGNLGEFLETTKPQQLKTTMEVMNERSRLEACIQNLKEKLGMNEAKQNEIRQIEATYNKHKAEMNKNKNFTIEVDKPYKVREPIRGGRWGLVFYEGAITCPNCEETCHSVCTMAWYPAHCEVMKKGHCTVCTNKCHASVHVKEAWSYVIKTRKVQQTLKAVKEKYEQNKAECENKESLLKNLEKETNKLRTEWLLLLDEAYSHVIKLEKIALNVNSGSTLA